MSSVTSVVSGPPAAPAGASGAAKGRTATGEAADPFGPLLARALGPSGRRGDASRVAEAKPAGTGPAPVEETEAGNDEERALEALAAGAAPPPPAPVPAAIGAGGRDGVDAADGVAAAAAPDPRRVEKGMERLDPEFRTRLARVVERMRSEHGHEVKVVETLRPQERQDFLFEQGRTRPGPVVTWTRSSNHTLGRAADVMIDGTYENAKGYAHLAQIASEEGLRTLGPKDPGHVELPRGARPLPSLAGPPQPAAPDPAGQVPIPPREAAAAASAQRVEQGMARVAEVARTAEVARVAQAAPVAQVAQPGRVAAAAAPVRSGRGSGERRGSDDGGSRSGPDASLLRVELATSAFAQLASPSALEAASAPGGVDAASRLARILEVRDGAAAGPMGHVLLRVDNGAGGEDLIRVDMRGNTVGADIDLANPSEIDQLLTRLPELQRALEKHGLETERLQVRNAAGLREAAEVARLVANADVDAPRGGSGGRAGSDSGASRERGETAPQGQTRRDTDEPRQQSRRNQKGENNP